jgi:ATP diphosphatase
MAVPSCSTGAWARARPGSASPPISAARRPKLLALCRRTIITGAKHAGAALAILALAPAAPLCNLRPMPDAPTPEAAIARLIAIMARLRAPDGCPWDQVQDFASIAPYTIEEAYEVADAIARGPDFAALQDELGDLLFQVVYHARMAEEAGRFGFAQVAESISDKMIRRHPHVFGEAEARSEAGQVAAWEVQKAAERAARAETGTLAGVPDGLPALTRALKISRRAARVGFDWPDAGAVLDKLEEEAAELRAELPAADKARLADEVGDLLFVLANLARKLDLDPEECLRGANAKFSRRFNGVEQRLAEKGFSPGDAGLEAMEAEWQAVKRAERGG